MTSVSDPFVGNWRPHRPRGPVAALYSSPGPKYALPGLTGHTPKDPTKNKAPAYSMGTRHAEFSGKCSPGPAYVIPANTTRTGRDGTPAYSLIGRPKETLRFKGPGPGHYSPEVAGKSVFRSAPAFSLSARSKEFRIGQTPAGPASYMLPPVMGPKVVTKPSGPAASIYGRSQCGSFHEDLKKTPGPAAYKVVDTSVYREKAPQHTITGRNFGRGDTTPYPGPAAYQPEQVSFTKAKAPSFTFGLRHSEYMAPLIINTDY